MTTTTNNTTTNDTTNTTGTRPQEKTMTTTTHTEARALHTAAATAWTNVAARDTNNQPTKAATKAATKASDKAREATDALVDAGWDEDRTDTDAVRSAPEAAQAHACAADEHREAAKDDAPRGMSATLDRYKPGYTQCVAYSGSVSQNNGDALAQALEGKSPAETIAFAERVLGLPVGTLAAKYAGLNPGQQRMNSGNRVRNAIKRGDVDASVLASLA